MDKHGLYIIISYTIGSVSLLGFSLWLARQRRLTIQLIKKYESHRTS